jgi:Cu+-exporting ATPase
MRHVYYIEGMSCNACITHVEGALSKVDGVSSVAVDLQKAEAVIEIDSHIYLEKLQTALKDSEGNYSISLRKKKLIKTKKSLLQLLKVTQNNQ